MTNVMAENDLILYPSGREVPEQTQGLTEDMTKPTGRERNNFCDFVNQEQS